MPKRRLLSFKMEGFNEAVSFFDTDIKPAIVKTVEEVSTTQEQEATKNIDERIYGQPESPNYRRTGQALGGRLIRHRSRGTIAEVQEDSRLKGASKDHNIFLNLNKKIPKLNTKYFDDAVKETTRLANGFLWNNIKKIFQK